MYVLTCRNYGIDSLALAGAGEASASAQSPSAGQKTVARLPAAAALQWQDCSVVRGAASALDLRLEKSLLGRPKKRPSSPTQFSGGGTHGPELTQAHTPVGENTAHTIITHTRLLSSSLLLPPSFLCVLPCQDTLRSVVD